MEVDPDPIAQKITERAIDRILSLAETKVRQAFAYHSSRNASTYNEYLEKKSHEISMVRNILYSQHSANIHDLYVPIKLSRGQGSQGANEITDSKFFDTFFLEKLNDGTAEQAEDIEKKTKKATRTAPACIVVGPAGSGKSIFLKRLFLRSTEDVKSYVPLFIELRSLNGNFRKIVELIKEDISKYTAKNVSLLEIKIALKVGLFSIVLDGFDEVDPQNRQLLQMDIVEFSNKYGRCPIVVSSRPSERFFSWNTFSTYHMAPLELDGAIELVVKSEYTMPDKDKFISQLRSELFETHKEFASNPLLLTVMIVTVSEVGGIAKNRHHFLQDAFDALWWRHDSRKINGFNRVVNSSFDKVGFQNFFGVFCLQTYLKEAFEISETEIEKFITKTKKITNIEAKTDDIIYDFCVNASLMIYEGRKYFFSHRYFQEFFVAKCISGLDDARYVRAIDSVGRRAGTDEVIPMLMAFDKDKVERIYVGPFLQELKEIQIFDAGSIQEYAINALGYVGEKTKEPSPETKLRASKLEILRVMYKMPVRERDIQLAFIEFRDRDWNTVWSHFAFAEKTIYDDKNGMKRLQQSVNARNEQRSLIDQIF